MGLETAPTGFLDFRTLAQVAPRPVYVERFYMPDEPEYRYLTRKDATAPYPPCCFLDRTGRGVRVLLTDAQVRRLGEWQEKQVTHGTG